MGFKGFVIDSIKYTIQNKMNFLVFGLLLIVIAFVPGDFSDINFSNLIISLPLTIIGFFLLIIQGGYLTKVLIDFVKGSDTIPPFKDIFFYIKEGIKDLVLGMYYILIPLIILMIFTEIPEKVLGDFLYIVLALLLIVSGYLVLLMVQTAVLYSVIEGYKKAFNMIYIFKKSREIGFKRLNLVLILSILIFGVVSSIVVANNDIVMSIIFVIIGFILYPTLAIMDVRYLGLIGRDIVNKK